MKYFVLSIILASLLFLCGCNKITDTIEEQVLPPVEYSCR